MSLSAPFVFPLCIWPQANDLQLFRFPRSLAAMDSHSCCSTRTLRGDELMSGSYLQRLCKEHLQAFAEHDAALPPPLELTWGSICSGGEGILFSFEALTVAFESKSVPVTFKHLFCCEIKPSVVNWLLAVPEATHTHACCVFNDACDMANSHAYCHRHKKKCAVPCVDILITGTSCKDFSRASNSYGSFESILALESWLQQAGCSDHNAFTQLVLCVRSFHHGGTV